VCCPLLDLWLGHCGWGGCHACLTSTGLGWYPEATQWMFTMFWDTIIVVFLGTIVV